MLNSFVVLYLFELYLSSFPLVLLYYIVFIILNFQHFSLKITNVRFTSNNFLEVFPNVFSSQVIPYFHNIFKKRISIIKVTLAF